MKISMKLFSGFFLVIGLMIILGIYSFFSLSMINSNGEKMYKDELVPILQIGQIAQLAENTRVQMLTAVLYEINSICCFANEFD